MEVTVRSASFCKVRKCAAACTNVANSTPRSRKLGYARERVRRRQGHAAAHSEEFITLNDRDADTPLSHLGKAQAGALGEWLVDSPDSVHPDTILR